MLKRLRRTDAKATAAASPADADEPVAGVATVAALTPSTGKPLTVDEKAALLTDKLVEIVPGIIMPFSRQELRRLKKRFASLLPVDSLAHASFAACSSMPELACSPFARLALQLVLSKANGPTPTEKPSVTSPRGPDTRSSRVSFEAFLTLLSIFSVKQPTVVKRHVLFLVYDADRDGRVSVDDFATTLHLISPACSRVELKAAVATQFPTWTQQAEATLIPETFSQLFTDADVHTALSAAF